MINNFEKYFVLIAVIILLLSAGKAEAVNGVNMIGIGPVSRSMGGVGIAAPQDSLGSIFANPATMSLAPFAGLTQIDMGATVLNPHSNASLENAGLPTVNDSVNNTFYLGPAIGVSTPMSIAGKPVQFGLGLAATTGLGQDYQGKPLDNSTGLYGIAPLIMGQYTFLGALKVAPSFSTMLTDKLSVGLGLHIDQISADLGFGSQFGYTWGVQAGIAYKVLNGLTVGLTYITKQAADLDNIADLNGDGKRDSLKVALPQQAGFGVSYSTLKPALLLEADVKWINWSNADTWEEFDWQDQWAFGFGVQYKVISPLSIRLGYNYSKNQAKEHNGFNGALGSTTNVQGKAVPTYYYETIRTFGLPAFFEHRFSAGLGYQFTKTFGVNLGYMREIGAKFRESGTNLAGLPTHFENKLTNDSYDFSLSWTF